jgi:hypothetical protein
MVGELLVWAGVAVAAFAAWCLYKTTPSGLAPRDQEPQDSPNDESQAPKAEA